MVCPDRKNSKEATMNHNSDESTQESLFKLELRPQTFLIRQDRRVVQRSKGRGFVKEKKTASGGFQTFKLIGLLHLVKP